MRHAQAATCGPFATAQAESCFNIAGLDCFRSAAGGYDDARAVGFSAAGVVASNLLSQGRGTLTLDGGVGFGTDEGEVAGRAGMSFGW
jgi:hypothetical protein